MRSYYCPPSRVYNKLRHICEEWGWRWGQCSLSLMQHPLQKLMKHKCQTYTITDIPRLGHCLCSARIILLFCGLRLVTGSAWVTPEWTEVARVIKCQCNNKLVQQCWNAFYTFLIITDIAWHNMTMHGTTMEMEMKVISHSLLQTRRELSAQKEGAYCILFLNNYGIHLELHSLNFKW